MRKTRKIKLKDTFIGGNNNITIQTMLDFPTKRKIKVINTINRLYKAGCDIIRVAVKDNEDVEALKYICKKSPIPVIADIHFDYKLAIRSIKNGAHKIRINPGNIGSDKYVKEIIDTALEYNVPIRIGVNSGSLPKKYKHATPEAMVETALDYIDFFEKNNFFNIVISLKSSDVNTTVKAYELLADKTDYPFHVGITESGIPKYGIIKSSIGIGILINKGLVNTMRVSLTADCMEEIAVGRNILKFSGFKVNIPELISCPTCGRCEIDLINLSKKVDNIIKNLNIPLKVAVMGCVVNGPGEAKEADIGIAGGKDSGIVFIKGEVVETAKQKDLIPIFKKHLKILLENYSKS